MKWKQRGKRRTISFLLAAVMMFTFVLSNGTAMNVSAEDSYNGPTVNAQGVTFYYYDSNNSLSKVYIKGSWDGSWGCHIPLTNDGNGNWSVTVPFSGDGVTGVTGYWGSDTPGQSSGTTTVTFNRGTKYEYGFEDDIGGNWLGSDGTNNPTGDGSPNSEILSSPYVSADSITVYYYPEHGVYPTITLKYRTVGSSTDWSNADSVTMSRDTAYPAVLSATIATSNLTNGSYEYKLYNGSTEVSDVLAEAQTFTVGDIPTEDPSVTSPVVNGNDVTFNSITDRLHQV